MAVTVTVIQLCLTSSHPLSYVTCLPFNVPFHRLRLPGDSLPLTTTLFLDTSLWICRHLDTFNTSNRLILGYVSWEEGGATISYEIRTYVKKKKMRKKFDQIGLKDRVKV